MSQVKKVGIIGFGTVGSGVYETLLTKKEKVEKIIGSQFSIPVILVKDKQKQRDISGETAVTDSFEEFESLADLDAVVEASPDATTAYPFVRRLLQKGITVITANKELVAKHGEELLNLAAIYNCRLFFEAAVAGGIPVLTSVRHTLKTNDLERIEGVVNGTSNFILTKMREEGTAFQTALEEAQEHGYAEAVPDKDVDGWDAYYKTTILSHWIYGKAPVWLTEKPAGIRGTDVRDLLLADHLGGRIKHLASLEKNGNTITASVGPQFVLNDHPLYGVEGVNNGIHVKGSIVGSLLFQGAGAGKFPTASAVIEDLINFWSYTSEKAPLFEDHHEAPQLSGVNQEDEETKIKPEYSGVWLVTGKQLALQLEGQRAVEKLSAIKRLEGREAVLVKGKKHDVTAAMSTLNDTVRFYPVCGELQSILQLNAVTERSVS
ncbi:homoserine dehydrogenase [Salipaludibacillus sp. CUR1]|uniref:homoserine dehydrogenase n=1 Tax=Salipaludibacillus sp. CUR1 TaxID=2820003 RepID=UPI001E5F469E|nr:homoserine dehydrogenase [Salipaludibacillus sp. CUR1]MCE7793085.1 homoserine dehydrogenase [Salipaludibacillus sp. CUR1]